ncbi:MAG: helicase associated domain-containing protein [Bacteriovorax sp.]|nr:helicase associated domain-containing protein [Bacteriovorax sp.]
MNKQRSKKKILSAIRIQKLNEIGFIWEINNSRWKNNFSKLKEFKEIKRHCNVPQVYKEDHQLGIWVAEQRNTIYDDRFLERRKRLDEIGFSWSPIDEKYEEQFKKLLEF